MFRRIRRRGRMGNQPSSSGDGGGGDGGLPPFGSSAFPNFRRTTGSLGLSKAELEERSKPSGLYPNCQWDERAIRRLIGDGKLAARMRGADTRLCPTDRECPICFLNYSEINETVCCQATVCTECYLQIRPQREKQSSCPFCNNNKLTIKVAKSLAEKDVKIRDEDEQRIMEATMKARDSYAKDTPLGPPPDDSQSTPSSAFGSSLQRHPSLRGRTFSSASTDSQVSDLSDLALTPDERRALEQEMRSQRSHPLSQRMEAEADERRVRNEREFRRLNGTRLARYNRDMMLLRAHGIGAPGASVASSPVARIDRPPRDADTSSSSSRDWNRIVSAFEEGGNGDVQSLDDLVVIEAAILLSMEEEAARRRAQQRNTRSRSAAAAIPSSPAASAGLPASLESAAASDTNAEPNHVQRNAALDTDHDADEVDPRALFNASSHARAGFPLLHSIMSRSGHLDDQDDDDDEENIFGSSLRSMRRGRLYNDEEDGYDDIDLDDDGVALIGNGSQDLGDLDADDSLENRRRRRLRAGRAGARSARGLNSSRSARAARLLRHHERRNHSMHFATAGMLMRGISEEQQMAMAIAMSLRDAEAQRDRENDSENGPDGDSNGADANDAHQEEEERELNDNNLNIAEGSDGDAAQNSDTNHSASNNVDVNGFDTNGDIQVGEAESNEEAPDPASGTATVIETEGDAPGDEECAAAVESEGNQDSADLSPTDSRPSGEVLLDSVDIIPGAGETLEATENRDGPSAVLSSTVSNNSTEENGPAPGN